MPQSAKRPTFFLTHPVDEMVLRVIDKYKDHPSIVVIKQHVTTNCAIFKFSHVSPTEVMESAKLRAKRAKRANVPTCQIFLRANVP